MRVQIECLNRSLRRLVESDSGATAVTTPYPSSSSNSGSKNALPRLDSNQNAYTQTSCQESPIVINEEGGGDSTSGVGFCYNLNTARTAKLIIRVLTTCYLSLHVFPVIYPIFQYVRKPHSL